MVLSKRLQTILELSAGYPVLADIGTDHAHLPIMALQRGICESAIACDLHPGPLAIAQKNIRTAGLSGQIQTRLGDGLVPLAAGEADCIVIAGMGGMRILDILSKDIVKARAAKRLILQPQHDWARVREGLHQASFAIDAEHMLTEGNRFYLIVVAQPSANVKVWPKKTYFTGTAVGPAQLAFLQTEKDKLDRFLRKMSAEKHTDSRDRYKQRLNWLDEAIIAIT